MLKTELTCRYTCPNGLLQIPVCVILKKVKNGFLNIFGQPKKVTSTSMEHYNLISIYQVMVYNCRLLQHILFRGFHECFCLFLHYAGRAFCLYRRKPNYIKWCFHSRREMLFKHSCQEQQQESTHEILNGNNVNYSTKAISSLCLFLLIKRGLGHLQSFSFYISEHSHKRHLYFLQQLNSNACLLHKKEGSRERIQQCQIPLSLNTTSKLVKCYLYVCLGIHLLLIYK